MHSRRCFSRFGNAAHTFRAVLGRFFARQTRNFSRVHLPLVENRIYNAARPHLRDTGDLLGFSLGGDGRALMAGASVSAEFVNVLLHNLSLRDPKGMEAVNAELEDAEWARNALRSWLPSWRR